MVRPGRVRNLILEGLNLGLTYRNQFDELMQANGNNVDKAIDAWAELVVADGQSLSAVLAIPDVGTISVPDLLSFD